VHLVAAQPTDGEVERLLGRERCREIEPCQLRAEASRIEAWRHRQVGDVADVLLEGRDEAAKEILARRLIQQ